MARTLRPNGAPSVRIELTREECARFKEGFLRTVWDNLTGVDADYFMLSSITDHAGGCSIEFTPMCEVDGPGDWYKEHRYVGNPFEKLWGRRAWRWKMKVSAG